MGLEVDLLHRREGARWLARTVGFLLPVAFLAACGSTGSVSAPDVPQAKAEAESFLVDVGGQFKLNASSSVDPSGKGLQYTWTIVHPLSSSQFQDHCEEDFEVVCISNDDDVCQDDPESTCTSNADCVTGQCLLNSGTTSSDCVEGGTTGICRVGEGRSGEEATFVADLPGPYTVRLLVQTASANDIDVLRLDTFPSLYLVGSLLVFGGTQGEFLGPIDDAETFAPDADRGAANPQSGNVVVVDPVLGAVREFDIDDGSVVGSFGETAAHVSDPVDVAFSGDGKLYVVEGDGHVSVFDAESGLFLAVFGDVTGVGESVASIEVSPVNGDILVVDGGAGKGVRAYSPSGNSLGVFGDTASVGQAVDLAFLGSPATDLFVADADGDLLRCAPDGSSCASFGVASSLLAAGGPTSVATNPSYAQAAASQALVLVADSINGHVVACDASGASCAVFGETASQNSNYLDLFFAPPQTPTTTTVSSTTTSTTTTLP